MHHIKPTITKQNGKSSVGKGFSPNELKEAGVNKQLARQIGLPVDIKRKSTHQENVATVKAHAQQATEKAAANPKPTKTKAPTKKKAKS
jgi:large subunit ribosomal protein L13e